MKISVIIPALNEEEFIAKTLEQVVDASKFLHTPFAKKGEGEAEVIVVDGGSSDRTGEIAGKFAKVVKSKPGRGIQMNAGAKEATGDILFFLHADTVLPGNWREGIVSVMSDEKIVGGAFGLSIDSDRLSHKIISSTATVRSRMTGIPYGDQGIFVRRSVFEENGGFKDIPIMEDVELMGRLKKMGKVVLLKDKVKTSARRWEKEGVIYTTLRNWLLISLYCMGVSPERLYRFYKAVR